MSPSMRTLHLGLLLVCAWAVDPAEGGVNATFFMRRLVQQYGTGEQLNASQAQELLNRVRQVNSAGHDASGHNGVTLQTGSGANCSSRDVTCLSTKCLSAADLFDFHQVPQDGADVDQVSALVPGLLYQLQNEACTNGASDQDEDGHTIHKKRADAKVWGYGFLAVTIINICPVLGIFFYPLMRTKIYRKVLMCTVGFAVGTLSASAILVLIPEGFELLTEASPFQDIFRWRGLVVIAGLFIFFNIERALSYIFQRKERAAERKARMAALGMNNKGFEGDDTKSGQSHELEAISELRHSHAVLPPATIVEKWAPARTIKPVAWMIIIGDALHNFMDGLSIGSAFTKSPSAGVGISLAIFSEELPHELGDFAVLLNAGMSLRQAAVMNFISAVSCYLGLIAGVQIGEIDNGAYWVFALTGGMFLYISLVEMLPEMNEQAREEEELTGHVAAVFLIQNFGLVVGWLIIFLVSYYSSSFVI